MKKKISLALSFLMLTAGSVPAYANANALNDELTLSEIRSAIASFGSDATEHLILNADKYEVSKDLDDFYYGTPFYGYLYGEETESLELNRSIIYYPLIIDNSVESILTVGKTENGDLFCTIGKDFSDELNSHLDEKFICVGDGFNTYFVDEKETLAVDEEVQGFSDGLIVGDSILTPSITRDELGLFEDDAVTYSIGANGGTLTNFPKVRQTTSATCVSACLLAVARYLHPSTFASWTDVRIHNMEQSDINTGLTIEQAISVADYVLNDVGGDDYTFEQTGRLTFNGIVSTLYNNQLPAFAGYGRSGQTKGHFVVLCGFSRSGSNNFSAEFMDPFTASYKYSTASDTDFAITLGGATYYWKQTINIR